MADKIYFRPAIPFLISLLGGILLGSEISGYTIWAVVFALICAGFGLLHILRKKNVIISPFFFFMALGYLSIQPWLSPGLPDNHIIHYSDAQRWNITGRIITQPQIINNRIRFHLQVASVNDDNRTHFVTGKLRVTVSGDLPVLDAGDKIRFNSRIRSLANFKNPGGFDYKRYMAFKGILATAYVEGNKLKAIDNHLAGGFFQHMDSVRDTFTTLIEKSGQPQAQGVFKALIIGDRSQISPATRRAFNRAGVGHLLAISGLHVGIVATVAFGIFHYLLALSKTLLWRAWTRKGAALLSLLPVVAYGIIAGLSPSTQRAVIMISIFLMTFLFEKDQDPFNTLALAAMVILIVDPPSLFSISFQLSFAAVLSIIYGFSWLQNRAAVPRSWIKEHWRLRLVNRLVSFFLVSLFAICGSLPLVAFYFNQISLVGLAANFLVVPLVGFMAVPLGLAALFLLPLSTTLAFWCVQAGCWILTQALAIVYFFADLPFAAVKTFTPSLLEIGCVFVLGWAMLNVCRDSHCVAVEPGSATVPKVKFGPVRPGESPSNDSSGLRRILNTVRGMPFNKISKAYLARAAVLLVLITLSMDICYWLYQRYWHPELRITIIDVGHGSSALLELPGGYTMLIDGGGFSDNSAFDVGKSIVAPLLYRKKIRTVDALVLSHPNSDHLNGLLYIAKHFRVRRIWSNNEVRETLGFKKFMEVIANQKIKLPTFSKMARTLRLNGVQLDFLYPPQDFLERMEKEKWRNFNNNSLVVKVSLGSTSFLFPGDIMAAAEKELVSIAGSRLNSTVLIAPHHGSRSSSSSSFLSEVNPAVVIVSSGRQGRFKLPNPTVIKKYQKHGCSIFRTDINGAVSLSTDGQQLKIKPYIAF